MADKVQKIREAVEKLKSQLLRGACSSQTAMETLCKEEAYNEVLAILDTMQEEPTSVWHNMDEIPIKGEVIVVQTKDTFYGLSVQKGGTTYKNKNKDRYVKWAYASDLLNLSNVERTTKNWKEPVSEDLENELDSYIKANFTIDKEQLDRFGIKEKDYMYSMDKSDIKKMVRYFTGNYKIPVSDDLEEAAKLYVSDSLCITGEEDWDDAAIEALNAYKAGAEWKKEQMMAKAVDSRVYIDAGGYPYIPQMELYDYDKDVPLAKEGDKYKVILIKE